MVKNINETAVKDLLDVLDDIKDIKDGGFGTTNTSSSKSSIARASKDLIMYFPVLCDNSIDPRTAAMICKAVERKAVAMLQLLFSSVTFMNNDVKSAISRFHTNMSTDSMSLDDYIELCDDLESRLSEGAVVAAKSRRLIKEGTDAVMRQHRQPAKRFPVNSLSEHSVNDYKINPKYNIVMEAPLLSHPTQLFYVKKSRDKKGVVGYTDPMINDSVPKFMDTEVKYFQAQLLDNDVKKCNELVPSIMIVKYYTPIGDTFTVNQAVVGVKARLISMDSYDIIDRISSKNKDRNGFVNFIRATTKEISFVKDYLLAIDRAKIDAKRNSIKNRSNSRIWKTLEKRATKSVWKRLIGANNDASAITTLVVSQQVVNALRKEYDVNIADTKVAKSLMDSFNLLAVCIVDESTEVARFLYDGDDYYEDLSFNSLERESGDGSYKKVINLLSKMNR